LLRAVQEVADSLSRWRETSALLEAQDRTLSSQQESLGFTQVRFRSGLDDRRAMLSRQHAVLDQEYALRTLEADKLLALVDLMEALGGSYLNNLRTPEQNPEQQTGWWPWSI
jgi:outer membrane protein TolC